MKQIKVAVIDSGIDLDVLNVNDKKKIDEGFLVQENSKGSIKIKRCLPSDMNGHGTACAVMINRLAPKAKIVPISVLDANGRCSPKQLVAALNLVSELEVSIVNMSVSSNDFTIIHDLKMIIKELEAQGKICIASKSNDRRISYPASIKNVIGVEGSFAIFNNGYMYKKNKEIQVMASGAAELLQCRFKQHKFFRGNSKATAIVSGIVANSMEKKDGCIGEYLSKNTWSNHNLYQRIQLKCHNREIVNLVNQSIKKLIDNRLIRTKLSVNGELLYHNSPIDDCYTIVYTLEKIFGCKVFGQVPVYRLYFKNVEFLGTMIEGIIKEKEKNE